jgi:hypothetical protein
MTDRIKAIIKKVGTLKNGRVDGWQFDCSNGAGGLHYGDNLSVKFIAGYTFEELKDVQLRYFLAEMRKAISELGWEAFMMNIGSLMAEQVDKTPESQSTALFRTSDFIHAMKDIWKDCGTFEYKDL